MFRHITVLAITAALAGCATPVDPDGPAEAGPCTTHPDYTGTNPTVTIHTEFGNITGEFFVDKVPNTAMNFVKLAEDGHFDGVPFHRIITDFMMQGGDTTNANGTGGNAHPDCADADGEIEDEFHADLRHDKPGVFSMANRGADTGSSQFFITFVATPWLDDKHAVFGQVIEGMDVVQQVNAEAGSRSGAPEESVTFESATVTW